MLILRYRSIFGSPGCNGAFLFEILFKFQPDKVASAPKGFAGVSGKAQRHSSTDSNPEAKNLPSKSKRWRHKRDGPTSLGAPDPARGEFEMLVNWLQNTSSYFAWLKYHASALVQSKSFRGRE